MHPEHSVRIEILSTAVLVAGFACSTVSLLIPLPSPSSVIGCYAVGLGTWSGSRESPNPPAAIALLDSVGTRLL